MFLEQEGEAEEAEKKAEASPDALVMVVDQEEGEYQVTVLEPEESEKRENAENLSSFLSQEFGAAIGQTEPEADLETEEDNMGIQEILNLLLPYLNCMLLYFLLLFYGQNVGGCIILEKTSKLMDTFLIYAALDCKAGPDAGWQGIRHGVRRHAAVCTVDGGSSGRLSGRGGGSQMDQSQDGYDFWCC